MSEALIDTDLFFWGGRGISSEGVVVNGEGVGSGTGQHQRSSSSVSTIATTTRTSMQFKIQ